MDIWLVAAAAGAGYIATYWHNVFKEREDLSGSFDGNLIPEESVSKPSIEKKKLDQRAEPIWGSCPIRRRLQRHLGKEVTLNRESPNSDDRYSDNSPIDLPRTSANEMPCTSRADGKTDMNLGKHEEGNVLSLLGLQPLVFSEENNGNCDLFNKCDYGLHDPANVLQPEMSPKNFSIGNGFGRERSSLKSKWARQYSIKPLTSLESCLIAQLYQEHVETEEYVFSTLPSPSKPIIRPFIITDGNQVIGRASSNPLGLQFESDKNCSRMRGKESVTGLPPLPEAGLREPPRKLKRQRARVRHGRSNISNVHEDVKHINPHDSLDGLLLFFIGISVGMMSTMLSSKREVYRLSESLTQAHNLVQDLQEELEMKDSLTVKELANEACESQEIDDLSFSYQAPAALPPGQEANEPTHYFAKESHFQKAAENLESMNEIEAELEAELERLEINMTTSSLVRRSSGLDELDLELMAEVVEGELKADIINREIESDRDLTGSSTANAYPANYSVSPRELSLRLHELIQSRLEERIEELEATLQHTQNRLNLVEAERIKSRMDFSDSDIESPSTQGSPTTMEHSNGIVRPMFLNLADNALNAYNEAYSEFSRVAEIEENTPSTVNQSKQIEYSHLIDRDLFNTRSDGGRNGYLPYLEVGGWESRNPGHDEMRIWDQIKSRESEDDEDDEIAKMLIKQIVEKTRQGSPVVLNAQKILFSMDE